jgi:hypothetical protein
MVFQLQVHHMQTCGAIPFRALGAMPTPEVLVEFCAADVRVGCWDARDARTPPPPRPGLHARTNASQRPVARSLLY